MDGKLLLRLPEVQERSGLTRTQIFELLRRGELESIRLGKKRLISAASLASWVEAQLEQARAARALAG